jgi:hypothetical protein
VYYAVTCVYRLALVDGADIEEIPHPLVVTGSTAKGRREPPSG